MKENVYISLFVLSFAGLMAWVFTGFLVAIPVWIQMLWSLSAIGGCLVFGYQCSVLSDAREEQEAYYRECSSLDGWNDREAGDMEHYESFL